MAEGHAPIKVGTGLIEVILGVPAKELAELRQKIVGELEKIGAASAKEVTRAVKNGLRELPSEVAKQAKKGKQAVEEEALDSEKTLKRIEKQITKEFGEEITRRFNEFRKAELKKAGLLQETSAETRKALQTAVRLEEQASRDRQRAAERLERERIRLIEQTRRAMEAAEREATREAERQAQARAQAQREALAQQVAAQRAAVRAQIAEIRRQAAEERAVLQDGIRGQQRRMADLRNELRLTRRAIADTSSTTQMFFARVEGSTKKMGTWFHEVGTSITEAGNLLATKFLGPLALAGSALTAVGVENADKRLLGQLGLTSAGVSKRTSADEMRRIQMYAIDTPYSINTMHEYQMKLIRSVAGADKGWYSKNPATRTKAANKAASQTSDLIMAIGDSMARAGNLAPDMFKRAMYALDMILDMDRAPTRNVKQLEQATGIPASELAQLLGFKNSTEMWTVIGTPAKDGGGVTGTQIKNALLNYWNPQKYPKGYNKAEGSVGFAERMTSQTITGRLQQMQERATFELGNLFVREGKDGSYGYTALGEKIMGKQVPVYKRDRYGDSNITGYRTEGGILDQVQDMAKKYAPDVQKFLGLFLDSLKQFISTVDGIVSWFKEHPVFIKLGESLAKFLIAWGPLIIGVGLLTKLIGKATGLVGRLFAPATAVVRGGVQAGVGAGRLVSQGRARNAARRDASEAGGSRAEIRQTGRDAYRARRTEARDGDVRGPGRRALDSFLGRDTNADEQRRRMRDLEDQMEEARQEAGRLRDELRDVNRQQMRDIAAALGGGSGSVQGAAQQASRAVSGVQTQAQQLNRIGLGQAERELQSVKEKADALRQSFKDAGQEVQTLNSRRLGSLRAQQVETTANRVGDLRSGVGRAADAVGVLNGKTLGGVRTEFTDTTAKIGGTRRAVRDVIDVVNTLKAKSLKALRDWFDALTDAADRAYRKIGQGTGAGSLAGRIGLLNGRSLREITQRVKGLADALEKAAQEAGKTDEALDSISQRAPGDGGSGARRDGGGKPKKTRRARGGGVWAPDSGVLPGYQPWVDSIPALLSPGESILRPEVTAALGESTIDSWNALAIRGRLSRHARGGVVGRGSGTSLDAIRRLVDLQNIAPVGQAMAQTMVMDSTSDALGGGVQGGILGAGTASSRLGGSAAANRFRGMYDWMTEDSWGVLRRVPTLVGQVAGVLGGALLPTIKDYFWDDVWRGEGNVIERGDKFLGHIFSTETLGKVWDDLIGGTWDSLSGIWNTAKDLVTDPVGSITDAISDVFGIVSGSYNNIVGMVQTVKDISQAPKEYAGQVFSDFMDTARDAMPNTKGLFDFSKGEKAGASTPLNLGPVVPLTTPGVGAGQWKGVASQALSMLGLPQSALGTVLYRIGMESGGNPRAVNLWDINAMNGTPSVGLMQVIKPTFDAYAGAFRGVQPQLYGVSIDPLANVYAGLNYAKHRYGSGWQRMLAGNTGYATGTMSASPGLALVGERGAELVDFRGGERVYTARETEALLNGKRYEIHVHEARNEPTPQAVLRALQTAEALYSDL